MIVIVLLILCLNAVAASANTLRAQSESAARKSFQQLSRAADEARNQNRDGDAIRLYKQGLATHPDWEEGLWYLSSLLYDREQYSDARDVLRRFLALRPDAGPGWAVLGASEFKTREYGRALDHLQRAMALGMGDRKEMADSTFFLTTVVLNRLERYDDSMEMIIRMIASNHDPASLIEPAGLAGLRLPLLPDEIPPDRLTLVRMAGEAVVAMQTGQDAEAKFKALESAYPNEPGVHFLCGAFFMPTRPEEGIQEMNRELEISPFHVIARVRIAEQYLREQKFDEALSIAIEAVKLEPRRASAHMLVGEAHVAKGDLAAGIKELEEARDDDPTAVRTHWDLVRAFMAEGRTEDATREKNEMEKLNRAEPAQTTSEGKTLRDQPDPR